MTDQTEAAPASFVHLLAAARAVLNAAEQSGPDGTMDDMVAALPALRRAVEAFDRMV